MVEPPELKTARVDARLRTEFAADVVDALVRAGSHHQPNERMVRHGEQRIRVVDRTARVVVPAGDLEHGGSDLRDVRRDGVRAPVRVERRVRDPTIPQRHVAATESLRQVDQRQVRERRPDVEVRRVLQRARAHEARPIDVDRREHHVFVRHDAPRIAARRRRRERRKMGRRAHGRVPRESSLIRVSDQPDSSVRAGQLRCPLDGVVPVAHVGVVVAEIGAVGHVAPAHVLRDEDVSVRRPVSARGMEDAGVRRALHDDAERSLAHRPRDIAGQLRAVARLHEDQRVLRHRVLRVRHRARPEQVLLLGDERRRPPNEPIPPATRLAAGEHQTGERVTVPRRGQHLIAGTADENRIAANVRAREVEHRFARAAADGARDAAAIGGEVRETHATPALETRKRRGAEGNIGIPIAGQ